jgi:succinyl-diaminopimelate desuccinylase
MNFREIFLENLETLRDLLKLNSVYDENSASLECPYGKGAKDALLFMRDLAIKDGFIVKEYDNQAISISYVSKDDRRIDVASHLDVVSVDDKWLTDPFGAVVKDGKIYGRGTSDMKTAAFLTYLCLKLLRDKYPDTPNEIRIVYGSDEERTMADMHKYYSMVKEPLFAFSPDGTFPMAIGEKGALMWTLSGDYNGVIESLDGGIQCNIVPPICKTTLINDVYTDALKKYIADNHIDGIVEEANGKTTITVNGKAVHCSYNWLGINAIIVLLRVISDVTNDKLSKNIVDILGENFGDGLDSKSGEEFGTCLTVNLGVLKINDGNLFAQVDGRYPSSITSDVLTKRFKEKCLVNVSLDYDDPATLCDINDPYVRTLLDTYREVTHDDSEPFISGGVSYSKVFKHCVTFGLSVSGKPHMAHMANEYVEIDDCVSAFEIYYKALEKLSFLEDK